MKIKKAGNKTIINLGKGIELERSVACNANTEYNPEIEEHFFIWYIRGIKNEIHVYDNGRVITEKLIAHELGILKNALMEQTFLNKRGDKFFIVDKATVRVCKSKGYKLGLK